MVSLKFICRAGRQRSWRVFASGCAAVTLLSSCESVGVANPAEGPLPTESSFGPSTAGVRRTGASPTVSVAAASARISQAGVSTYTVSASRVSLTSALTVYYAMGGTAIAGKNYTLSGLSGKMIIPAGANSASVTLTALQTSLTSGTKTASMTLRSGTGYNLSSSSKSLVTIDYGMVSPTPTPTPVPTPTPSPTATPVPTPSPTPSPRPTPVQEVWIAVRTDGLAGSGTLADPFDGSTPEKFDAVMNNFYWTPNLAVHLSGAGPFRTYFDHNWAVRPGWVLSGDGMDTTTIQVIGNVTGYHNAIEVVRSDPNGSTDNVTVRDLTIDCNWAELALTADTGAAGEKNIKTGAVLLWGSNNLVDHVRSINSYGSLANRQEQFAIMLEGPRDGDSTNNVIQFCRAELPQGNYGSPFALAGWVNTVPSHLITNSKVLACYAAGANTGLISAFTTGGVNLANVKDCQVDGNTFVDCFGAAYIDTGSVDGLHVTNNNVVRGWFGVGLSSWGMPKQNIEIAGNTFLIQNRVVGGASYGIYLGSGATTNVTISNNTIQFDKAGGGLLSYWGIAASSLTGASVSGNVVDIASYPVYDAATGSGVTLINNRTPAGALVPGLGN